MTAFLGLCAWMYSILCGGLNLGRRHLALVTNLNQYSRRAQNCVNYADTYDPPPNEEIMV